MILKKILMDGGIVTKRTMTWKSKYGFGKWAEQTLENLYKCDKKDYMIWAYYNMPNIDYIPEIKEKLGIVDIEKPGTNSEKGKEVIQMFYKKNRESMSPEERMKDFSNRQKERSITASNFSKSRDIKNTNKSRMAWINQGHGNLRENIKINENDINYMVMSVINEINKI